MNPMNNTITKETIKQNTGYYYLLGRLLYKYYNGELLTKEELETISSTTIDDRMVALDFNAVERLSKKNDESYKNFLENQKYLKVVNLQPKSSEKSL